MTVKERIKEFIASKKITVQQFEKLTGLSNGYINNISNSISLKKNRGNLWLFPGIK
jgi:transcriptional regulator with XRE-family HTH domain